MVEFFGEISPVLLIAMLPGLYQMLKKWTGLVDNPAEWMCFGVGFVLVFLYQLKPILGEVYWQWFSIVLYSALAPLIVMGYYKLVKESAINVLSILKG